jgi:hypothetical protein
LLWTGFADSLLVEEAMAKKKGMQWKSKIVGHDRVQAGQLLANPFNHRRHPEKQREVVSASIEELGFIKSVIVNRTTGHIIDGHERVMQALGIGEETLVDVEYVELSPDDEKKALLILDASREMAGIDNERLHDLVNESALPDFFDDYVKGLVLSDSGPQKKFAAPLTRFLRVEVEICDSDAVKQGLESVLNALGLQAAVEVY